MSVERGIVALPWVDHRPGSQVARAALFYLYSQTETGTQCPLAMSYGVVPVLRRHSAELPQISELWLPRLLARRYDSRFIPAQDKSGVLFGMGMTERQGGSDVRRNVTVARPVSARGPGRAYAVTGHKWFFSAPMCDAFLVLAQTEGGIACLLVPRFRDDGTLNALHLQRLKNKLGNHSNASAEVEFHGAQGFLLGEEGRGIATIIEMATYTRLDCVLATAGMQRRALSVAISHAAERKAFGSLLIDKPLMSSVLADLAVESEAATGLALYLAGCFESTATETERLIQRILTPAAKFHICKRGPGFAAEALEVLGGNGYVEELDLARIYREMPLLSIWEGSGNVMCLDVLRVAAQEPEALDAFIARIDEARGGNATFDAFAGRLPEWLHNPSEADGRRVAHAITLAMQAALLIEHAPAAVADVFCATRLVSDAYGGTGFGLLPRGADSAEILQRSRPQQASWARIDKRSETNFLWAVERKERQSTMLRID
jgi:putative acyl-CoA dehydrogenase